MADIKHNDDIINKFIDMLCDLKNKSRWDDIHFENVVSIDAIDELIDKILTEFRED